MVGLLLGYASLMGCLFVVQGIYILRTRNIRGIVGGLRPTSNFSEKPKLGLVVACAAVYVMSGVALGSLVVVALFKRHIIRPTLPEPRLSSLPHLLGPLFLIAVSSWALVQPSGLLGWVKRPYPGVDLNNAFLRAIVRVCAAGCLAIGVIGLLAFA